MVTVSNVVKKIVQERPLLHEAMEQDIVSYANLAEQLKTDIEGELGKPVQHAAIVMALRRHAETMKKTYRRTKFDYHSEIIMKSNLCDIAAVKSQTLFAKVRSLYDLVDYDKGDVLNIIYGSYEVAIVTNMKHLERFKKVLAGEKLVNIEQDLVSLSLKYSKDFLYTPGVISTVVKKLTWENVNIFELVSTLTELTFIISTKDSIRGYNALQKLVHG